MIKKFSLLSATVLLLVTLSPLPSQALDAEQKKIFDLGIKYFNLSDNSSGGSCAITLPGSDNAEKVWNFLVNELELTAEQAAGAMGNIEHESGFNPHALNPGTTSPIPVSTNRAWGLIQWMRDRQTNLINFAKEREHNFGENADADLVIQLQFMKHELETRYRSSVLDPLKRASTVAESTRVWLEKYEAPCPNKKEPTCDPEQARRLPKSENYLNLYGSSAGESGSGSVVGCSNGSGQIVGGYSLPTSRDFYDQNIDRFTKPHHDYPAIDVGMPEGTPIFSVTAGKVFTANQGGACGKGITIITDDGTKLNYCHGIDGGSIPGAKLGDSVNPGQLIMHSGNTGNSSGPHLHLQITTPDGHLRCPQSLMTGIAAGNPPAVSTLPTSGCTN